MNIENNLFYYATKELSQDAFICWLCSYALAGSDPNDALRECALEMIKVFMEDNKSPDSINKSDILLESIEKQVGNIDVLLTVRYRGDHYKIIIEDKVYSAEHDNQLERYVSQTNDKDSSVKVIGVYFKTGFQSDYSNVIKADYRIINRLQIIKILEPYVDDSKSEILADYYNYWSQFDEISKRYRVAPLSEWDWRGVNGFYENLKEVIHEPKIVILGNETQNINNIPDNTINKYLKNYPEYKFLKVCEEKNKNIMQALYAMIDLLEEEEEKKRYIEYCIL